MKPRERRMPQEHRYSFSPNPVNDCGKLCNIKEMRDGEVEHLAYVVRFIINAWYRV